ncbi:MAG: hypothetical protein ABR575_12020 [Actinomycetota bacterium]
MMEPRSYRRITAVVLAAGLGAIGAAIAVQLILIPPEARQGAGNWKSFEESLTWALTMLTALVIGAIVGAKQPWNRIGWVLSGGGVAGSIALLGDQWGRYALRVEEATIPGGRLGMFLSFPGLYLCWALLGVLVPLLFPDGRFRSRSWKVIGWAGPAFALMWTTEIFRPDLFEEGYATVPGLSNPVGLPAAEPLVEVVSAVGLFGLFGTMFLGIGSLLPRVFTASGRERQQIKVVAYTAVTVTVVSLVGANLHGPLRGTPLAPLLDALLMAASLAIPISFGLAILRYRLYDIDIIVNRTLVYGLLTAALALSYVGAVFSVQAVLPAARGSNLAIAVSTLGVAALFRPLRDGIQRFIDRRFYRTRYDARRTVEAFAADLRDEVDLDTLAERLLQVVDQTMRPAQLSLWLRPDPPPPRLG